MPTVRLNALNVKTLPALKGRANYRDADTRGFMLRVTAKGARSYAITYSRKHRNFTYTLGETDRLTLKKARAEAKRLLAQVTLGEHPAEVKARDKRSALTIGDLVDQALAEKKSLVLRPSTRRMWEWIAKRLIKPTLERESAAGLTRNRIRAWGSKLANRSAYNAHAAFRVLRRVYSWAVENDELQASPFIHLKAPGLDELKESSRVLTRDELGALLLALDDLPGQYPAATRLLLLTMVRRESVLGARFPELLNLDGKEPRWVIPAERNKAAVEHMVPLSPAAVAIFKAQRLAVEGDIVFPSARRGSKAVTMQWSSGFVRELRARMPKGPRWTIHDLRRTGATLVREHLGVDRDLVRLLLGHSGGSGATRIYDRAERLQDRRRALESWADYLDTIKAEIVAEKAARDAHGTRGKPRRTAAARKARIA